MDEKPILFSGPMVRAILEGRKTQTRRVMKPQPVYDPELSQKVHTFGNDKGGWYWQAKNKGTWYNWDGWPGFDCRIYLDGPYGQPGDSLWVRETWQAVVAVNGERLPWSHTLPEYRKRENVTEVGYRADGEGDWLKWTPSIFMPRWASRITLSVVNVRVERLQDITEADAIAEGVERNCASAPDEVCFGCQYQGKKACEGEYIHYLRGDEDFPAFSARESYESLWDSINAKRPGCNWTDNPFVWAVEFKQR